MSQPRYNLCLAKTTSPEQAVALLNDTNCSGVVLRLAHDWQQIILDVDSAAFGRILRHRSSCCLLHVVDWTHNGWELELYHRGICATQLTLLRSGEKLFFETAEWKPKVLKRKLMLTDEELTRIETLFQRPAVSDAAGGGTIDRMLTLLEIQPFLETAEKALGAKHGLGVTRVNRAWLPSNLSDGLARLSNQTTIVPPLPRALFGTDEEVNKAATQLLPTSWNSSAWPMCDSPQNFECLNMQSDEVLLQRCQVFYPTTKSAWRPYVLGDRLAQRLIRNGVTSDGTLQRAIGVLRTGMQSFWCALGIVSCADLRFALARCSRAHRVELFDGVLAWIPEMHAIDHLLISVGRFIEPRPSSICGEAILQCATWAGWHPPLNDRTEREFQGDWLAELIHDGVVEWRDDRVTVTEKFRRQQ